MPFNSQDNETFALDGYRLRLASGTSTFEGDSPSFAMGERPTELWSELNEENYRLLGDTLFTIDVAEKRPEVLSNILPRLHIELTLSNSVDWRKKNYVVLILDNARTSLVDWAFSSPISLTSLFPEPNADDATIYFDIPLVPVTEPPPRATEQEISPDDRANLMNQISRWEKGEQLTFGVFSIEYADIHPNILPLHYPWHWHLYPPFARRHALNLVNYMAQKADRHLKRDTGGEEQLQIVLQDGSTRAANPEDLHQMQMRGQKVLLLCHGILSSTKGAFSGILSDPKFLTSLHNRYNQNILAWDHYTLSKTTAENAADLLTNLGGLHGVELDIVCHSRGAGVVRSFVEDPSNQTILHKQSISIDKMVYVAGACLGSQLADVRNTNRLFRRLNMLYWCFGGAPTGFTRGILTVLKLLATIAQNMPGVESMNPSGREINTLNAYGKTVAQKYYYIMANFHSRHLPIKIIEALLWDSGVFQGSANDLVVPYEGASIMGKYLPNFSGRIDQLKYGSPAKSQSDVMHINFFTQAATKTALGNILI